MTFSRSLYEEDEKIVNRWWSDLTELLRNYNVSMESRKWYQDCFDQWDSPEEAFKAVHLKDEKA